MKKCPKCAKTSDDTDNYCRFCGRRLTGSVPFYHKPAGIWLMFLFIGPFALWFVFRSTVLSKREKFIYAIIMSAVSVWLINAVWVKTKEVLDMYSQLFNMRAY